MYKEKTIIKTDNIDGHVYTNEYPFIIDTKKDYEFTFILTIKSIEEEQQLEIDSIVKQVYDDIHIEDNNTTKTRTIIVKVDDVDKQSIEETQSMVNMINSKI